MINHVTITGADESIFPSELVDFSIKYPFVEWGILFSPGRIGSNRFPGFDWIHRLLEAKIAYPKMQLSAHLCGGYVRQLVKGDPDVFNSLASILPYFERIQINFHGIPHGFHLSMVDLMKQLPGKEWIFQYDNVNRDPLLLAMKEGVNASALFDLSHGTGVLPASWPQVLEEIPCGYAGGLGPDNLEEQIKIIEEKANGKTIWIDMETRVRSEFDTQFDMKKVETCLNIAASHISSLQSV